MARRRDVVRTSAGEVMPTLDYERGPAPPGHGKDKPPETENVVALAIVAGMLALLLWLCYRPLG